MAVTWPETLPPIERGDLSVTPLSNSVRTKKLSGRTEVRTYGSGAWAKGVGTLRLPNDLVATLQSFYARTCNMGLNWFTADWLSTMGYTSHVARFVNYPRRKGKGVFKSDFSVRLLIAPATAVWDDTEWPSAGPGEPGSDVPDLDYVLTQIYSNEHDAGEGTYNSMVLLQPGILVLAYAGTDRDGFIKVLSYDEDYYVTEIYAIEHDANNGTYNSLIKLDDTHLALVYNNDTDSAGIKIFGLAADYSLTTLSDWEFSVYGYELSLIKLDDTHLALAHRDYGYDAWLKIFQIDTNYTVSTILNIEHDTSNGAYNSLIQLDATHVALAYYCYAGMIKVFEIGENYASLSPVSVLEHDSNAGSYNSLIQLDATHVALAYGGAGGIVKVFEIGPDYSISQVFTRQHETELVTYNSLIKINDTHLALVYRFRNVGYRIKIFVVGTDYSLSTLSVFGSSAYNYHNSLIKLDDTHLALALAGYQYDGWLKIYRID